jgi:hypothetical protein
MTDRNRAGSSGGEALERMERARAVGLPPSATIPQIRAAERRERAERLGLSPTASRQQLEAAEMEEWRREEATTLGLPATASGDRLRRERSRREAAAALYLPEDSDWTAIAGEVTAVWEDEQRAAAAVQAGLPDTASWEEISRKAP